MTDYKLAFSICRFVLPMEVTWRHQKTILIINTRSMCWNPIPSKFIYFLLFVLLDHFSVTHPVSGQFPLLDFMPSPSAEVFRILLLHLSPVLPISFNLVFSAQSSTIYIYDSLEHCIVLKPFSVEFVYVTSGPNTNKLIKLNYKSFLCSVSCRLWSIHASALHYALRCFSDCSAAFTKDKLLLVLPTNFCLEEMCSSLIFLFTNGLKPNNRWPFLYSLWTH